MSDTQAQAESSEMAEGNSTMEDSVSDNQTVQEPLTGSDEAISEIADIDSYRNAANSLRTSPQAKEDAQEEAPSVEEEEAGTGTKATEETANEDASDEDDQAEAGRKKAPQYRWRPKTETDALAMDIIKRAEKSGKEISMREALAQAETILVKDDANADKEETSSDDSSLPQTVADAETLLKEVRAQRKQAFAKDLDFEKAAELDEKLEAIKDHIATLKLSEVESRKQSESQWERTLEESKAKAVSLYPDTTNAESELVQKMIEIDEALRDNGDALFHSPDKPLKLAQMAARELGLAPKRATTQAKPTQQVTKTASSQPVKKSPVQPASGNARTTQSQGGKFAVELEQVNDEESWRAAMSKLKTASA